MESIASEGDSQVVNNTESGEVTTAAPDVQNTPSEDTDTTEEITEEKPVSKLRERAKKSLNQDFDSDDAFEEALIEHLDGLEEYQKRGQEVNAKLISVFESEPIIADIVNAVIKGASTREALALHFDPEDLAAIEGDPDYDGWKKNSEERTKKLQEKQAREAEYGENLNYSQAQIQEFAQENNLTDEAAEKFLNQLDDVLGDLYKGRVSKQFLSMMQKALNYESDVQGARETGEITGRNENIEAKKASVKKSGDNLPDIKAASTPETEEVQPKRHAIDDIIAHTKRKQIL
jgi:hypothetical protein